MADPTSAGLVGQPGEDPWTATEIAEVRSDLTDQAERLRDEVARAESRLSGLMADAGDGAGHDQVDAGSARMERDEEASLVEHSRDLLAQTESALARIVAGSYGICEGCAGPVGKMRLMAFPRATRCLSCKRAEESQR